MKIEDCNNFSVDTKMEKMSMKTLTQCFSAMVCSQRTKCCRLQHAKYQDLVVVEGIREDSDS